MNKIIEAVSSRWQKTVCVRMETSLVVDHGIFHLYFLGVVGIHTPRLKACMYMIPNQKNTRDSWDIPRYTTRKRCITNKYGKQRKISICTNFSVESYHVH